ncbi:MAG: LytTR family DNA-binding domain-containing protein [Rhodothermales bacterium]
MIKALIADDEPLARARLCRLLEAASGVVVDWTCTHGEEVLDVVQHQAVDVAFLDVEMPGLSGLEVARTLQASSTHVVFVTAFETYAVEAFAVEAVAYLVKPFGQQQVLEVVARVEKAHRMQQDAALGDAARRALTQGEPLHAERPGRLAVRQGKGYRLVEIADIEWIESAGNYVRIHVGGQVFLHDATMQQMQGHLKARPFVRIHRSTMVNVAHIAELQPLFRGEYAVIMRRGTQLKLTRSYRASLAILLGNADRPARSPSE